MRNRPVLRLVVALVMVQVGLVGCSDSNGEDAAPTAVSTTSTSVRSTVTTLEHSTDETAVAAPPGAITVNMTSYEYTPSTLQATAGTVAIFLTNLDPPPVPDKCAIPNCSDHNFDIRDAGHNSIVKSARLAPGSSGLLTIEDLPPGHYEFRCTIQDHSPGVGTIGMTGTLELIS